jgi:4-hydroxy-tetrahydrodipicolinate synthase
VAATTKLPIAIYDVPPRTGRRIAHDVLVRLFSELPNVVAYKDATGDPPGAGWLLADVPSIEIYSGDDSLTLPLLAEGAVGVIGVATHWCAPEMGDMIRAFEKGDVVRAREINARLHESFVYENSDTCVFSQAAKAMMRTLGLNVGECRLPLGPAPAGSEERAREVYANLHA